MTKDLNTTAKSVELAWWKNEDWLSVGPGFLIIVLVLVGMRPQLPAFKWATADEFAATIAEAKPVVEKLLKDAEPKSAADLWTEAAVFSIKSTSRNSAGDKP